MDTSIIIMIILAITLLIASIIVIVLKNKTKNIGTIRQRASISDAKVKLVKSYCSPNEMRFVEAIFQALPKDFIAFPFVPLEKVLEPTGDSKVDYNIASCKVLDVCVFLQKTMEPVLAIDLYSSSPTSQTLKQIDEDVVNLLKNVHLPLIKIRMQDNYDINVLKNDLLNAMDDKIFAKIKK